ncbi:hypothetical protein ScPMuIL_014429 [Solemya velum]
MTMKNSGFVFFAVYVLLHEGFTAPVEDGAANNHLMIGQPLRETQPAEGHHPATILEASQKTVPATEADEVHPWQIKPDSDSDSDSDSDNAAAQLSDADNQKLADTFGNFIVDEINVENILQNALGTFRRHPEILKGLIENEEQKLTDKLLPFTASEDETELDKQLMDFQKSESKLRQASKEPQKKSKPMNMPFQEFKDFPADVSDPGAIIQYANAQKEDKTHDSTKPKEQVMSFDLSMLPVEGGIDDPMFLDTSQQTMEARQLMQTLQNENSGLENDVTSLGNKEQAISKKNSKPRMDDENLLDEKMVNDLKHDLALLTQEEKDNLFSFMPPKFKQSIDLPEKIETDKKDTDDLNNAHSANEMVSLTDNEPYSKDNNMGNARNGNTVSEGFEVPDHDFLVNIPEAEFLEKLRSMEEEAKSKLNFHDLKFPSSMMTGSHFLKNGKPDISPEMVSKLNKKDPHSEKPETESSRDGSGPDVAKRSDEDDLHALMGVEA